MSCSISTDEPGINQIHQYFDQFHNVIFNNSLNVANVALVESKIEDELNEGSTRLRTAPCYSQTSLNDISREIKRKNDKFNKDLLLLNMSLSQQISSRSKFSKSGGIMSTRSHRKTTKSVSSEEFNEYQKGHILTNMRIKELQKMQELLKLEKLERERRIQKRDELFKKSLKEEEDFEKRQKQLEKVNKINERLEKLEESKKQRIEMLKRNAGKSLPVLPKYKMIRYKFDIEEIKFEDEQNKKIHKIKNKKQKEYNFSLIKEHTIKYDSLLKERARGKTEGNSPHKDLSASQILENEKKYNKIGPNPEKIAESKKMIERINEYESITASKRMNMKLDPVIGKEFEAIKDKSKFPFKYHYLKIKKNLSNLEIYENFNFFNFNSDPIEIGNVYLSQLKSINEHERNNKTTKSEKKIKTEGSNHKLNYKNYLEEMKMKRKSTKSNNVEEIVQASAKKEKLIKVLFEEGKYGLQGRTNKKMSLSKPMSYSNAIKIQLEADQNIINSMKSKLKGLKLE